MTNFDKLKETLTSKQFSLLVAGAYSCDQCPAYRFCTSPLSAGTRYCEDIILEWCDKEVKE